MRYSMAAGVPVIFCFFGIALALSWASQPRPAKILRRFNGLWKERIAVELFGGLWLVRKLYLSTRLSWICLSVEAAKHPDMTASLKSDVWFEPLSHAINHSVRPAAEMHQLCCVSGTHDRLATLSPQAWQLTRMLALWGIHNQSLATTESTAKSLCRVYLGVGLGFLQPMFLLIALLLAQHSLGCAAAAAAPCPAPPWAGAGGGRCYAPAN